MTEDQSDQGPKWTHTFV